MWKAFDELTAADVVRGGGITAPEAMSLRGAARSLAEAEAVAALVVATQGRCVGLLCASDIVRRLADGEGSAPGFACYWSEWQIVASGESEVGRRMTTDPPVVPPDTPLRDVARELIARRTTAVLVDCRHRSS